QEHVNTAKIHHAYAVENPEGHTNYSDKNWGLTASDDPDGYTAHQPWFNDNGTVSPTAALGSMPYTPGETMKALKYFYRERGADLFGKYGFYDAFNDNRDWVAESYLGIDQGPIVVMIENYRTGLLWNNVMKDADVQTGLDKLGFQYEVSTEAEQLPAYSKLNIYPNPASDKIFISLPSAIQHKPLVVKMFTLTGQLVKSGKFQNSEDEIIFNVGELKNGYYVVRLEYDDKQFQSKIIIQKF
ncbi:MAG: glucoamylase family protein, partial [Tangfeifania sp.]